MQAIENYRSLQSINIVYSFYDIDKKVIKATIDLMKKTCPRSRRDVAYCINPELAFEIFSKQPKGRMILEKYPYKYWDQLCENVNNTIDASEAKLIARLSRV